MVKILCEKLNFRTSFEGRERSAMTERKGENSKFDMAEGPTIVLFSFEGGDAKSSIIGRRAQRLRKDIDLNKVSPVGLIRGSVSDLT